MTAMTSAEPVHVTAISIISATITSPLSQPHPDSLVLSGLPGKSWIPIVLQRLSGSSTDYRIIHVHLGLLGSHWTSFYTSSEKLRNSSTTSRITQDSL